MKRVLLPLILLTSLISCVDTSKFNDIHVNINTSMPAGSLNYTDKSLLDLSNLGDILVVNKDNILSVQYGNQMNLITPGEINRFFTFPKQELAFEYKIPFVPVPGVVDVEFSIPLKLGGMKNGEIINEIIFANGLLDLTLADISPIIMSQITWTIPQLTDNSGKVVSGKIGTTVNLAGLILKPGTDNALDIMVKGKFPVMPSIKGNLNLSSDKFTSLTGWIGRQNIKVDPIKAEFGNDFKEFNKYVGEAYFANPSFSFQINNSVGVPVLLSIDQITIGDNIIKLKQGLNTSKFLIDANAKTTITIDNSKTVNSDELSKAINPDANNVSITLSAVTNPTETLDGVESQTKVNHISNTSSIVGEYKIELPMDGWFKDIMFEEKISSVDLNTDGISYENMVMAFTGTNSMPLEIQLNGYAGSVTPQNQLFDKPAVIPAAINDKQPSVIDQSNIVVINLGKPSIDKLIKNKSLLFRFNASTRGADKHELVKFYSPTSIKLNIFLGVKADIY